jgi:hypothetical protein
MVSGVVEHGSLGPVLLMKLHFAGGIMRTERTDRRRATNTSSGPNPSTRYWLVERAPSILIRSLAARHARDERAERLL